MAGSDTPGSTTGRRRRWLVGLGVIALAAVAVPSSAVHIYRGPGGGCTPASGRLGDDPAGSAEPAATVLVLHNTFNDAATGLPVTQVGVGDTVEWQWRSAHCHSVQSAAFYSGFHYPAATPGTPPGVPGLFDHPIPEEEATLTYRHTFTSPGIFQYVCEHHAAIGMVATVVVE